MFDLNKIRETAKEYQTILEEIDSWLEIFISYLGYNYYKDIIIHPDTIELTAHWNGPFGAEDREVFMLSLDCLNEVPEQVAENILKRKYEENERKNTEYLKQIEEQEKKQLISLKRKYPELA